MYIMSKEKPILSPPLWKQRYPPHPPVNLLLSSFNKVIIVLLSFFTVTVKLSCSTIFLDSLLTSVTTLSRKWWNVKISHTKSLRVRVIIIHTWADGFPTSWVKILKRLNYNVNVTKLNYTSSNSVERSCSFLYPLSIGIGGEWAFCKDDYCLKQWQAGFRQRYKDPNNT